MSLIYKKEGKIAFLTLNRPEVLNAIDQATYKEISEALIDFKDDDGLYVAIITGSGEKAFSAGADIKSLLPSMKKLRGQPWAEPASIFEGLHLWKPVIAAVNGLALGGGMELAIACDLKIAAEHATFGLPEVRLGVIPGWGGTQRLPRIIPRAKAAELLLMGKPIDAQEAYRLGLVNKVVPLSDLMPTAKQIADELCQLGPLAVRAAKQAMEKGINYPIETGLEFEKTMVDWIITTEDFVEGYTAFLEKRRPEFKCK